MFQHGVAVAGRLSRGLSDCVRARGRGAGGRAVALHSDIWGGERLL